MRSLDFVVNLEKWLASGLRAGIIIVYSLQSISFVVDINIAKFEVCFFDVIRCVKDYLVSTVTQAIRHIISFYFVKRAAKMYTFSKISNTNDFVISSSSCTSNL